MDQVIQSKDKVVKWPDIYASGHDGVKETRFILLT